MENSVILVRGAREVCAERSKWRHAVDGNGNVFVTDNDDGLGQHLAQHIMHSQE